MCAVQHIEVVVNIKCCRGPRCGGMAAGTFCRQVQSRVTGIGRPDVVRIVTRSTLFGCTLKPADVALQTVGIQVGSGERESGTVVIEYIVGTTGRVACQTSGVIVCVTANTIMLIIGLRIGMTADTGVFRIVCRIGVAVGTLAPFALMFPAIYREML